MRTDTQLYNHVYVIIQLRDEAKRREVRGDHEHGKFCHNHPADEDGRGEDHPLDLLALQRRGHPPIAVQQGEGQTAIKSDAHQGIERGQPPVPGMGSTKDGKGQE